MRPLTQHEKRTIRLGALAITVYLLAFGGWQVWTSGAKSRSEYAQLLREAQSLKNEIRAYQGKARDVQKLMDGYHLDPAKLTRITTVAEASAALQKAAAGGGIAVGPVRESPSRGSGKELASVQLEGVGPVPAVTGFFHRLETVGYPFVVDTVQMTPEPSKPGQLKLSLTLIILDFDQWNKEAAPHA